MKGLKMQEKFADMSRSELEDNALRFYLQAERVQELEIYVDRNSKKHANLNVFLQERDTTSTLGMHVVDAVMQYAKELEKNIKLAEGQKGIKSALNDKAVEIIEEKEKEIKHYRESLNLIKEKSSCVMAVSRANKALESYSHE